MQEQVTDDEAAKAVQEARRGKLQEYFDYHGVADRYGITFEQFVWKVDNGVWVAYMADEHEHMTLHPRVRELCNSQ